jgi:hypothetical protein
MNGYPPYPQRPFPPASNASNVMDLSGDPIAYNIGGEQSLDDMVAQNDKANRRKSMPIYGGDVSMHMGSPDPRRLSMMDFSDTGNGDLNGFQFSMQASSTIDDMMRSTTAYPRTSNEMQSERVPAPDLAINTQFSNQSSPFPNMQGPGSAYASPMQPNVPLDMDITSPYPASISMQLDMTDPALSMMGADMNMFSGNQFATQIINSPIAQDFAAAMPTPVPDPTNSNNQTTLQPRAQFTNRSVSATSDVRSGLPTRTNSQEQSSTRSSSRPSEQHSNPTSFNNQGPNPPPQQHDPPTDSFANMKFPWETPTGGFPSTMHSNPHVNTQFKNAYSSTGFDMLGVLVSNLTIMTIQLSS